MTEEDAVVYLRSLPAIRERCMHVFDLAKSDELQYLAYHPEKEADVIDFCKNIIQRDFGSSYEKLDRVEQLKGLPGFPSDPIEQTKCLIDLYMVSVLLDAGAGNKWLYTEHTTGWKGGRSEGLAIASYQMFVNGVFSSSNDGEMGRLRVDAHGLSSLSQSTLRDQLQVTDDNPMDGLEGRVQLLIRLGESLAARPDIYKNGRPGDMLEYLLEQTSSNMVIPIASMWKLLLDTLETVWPPRLSLNGSQLGDVWHCDALEVSLKKKGSERKLGDDLVPFHKLSQWLCYSLIQPMEEVAGLKVEGWQKWMTGLPEVRLHALKVSTAVKLTCESSAWAQYRNGGLLVDLGVLRLRAGALSEDFFPNGLDRPPVVKPDHPAIIEWRAMTVICLDRVAEELQQLLVPDHPESLNLAQVLEAATWKGGRETAKHLRGDLGGGPPIEIDSDGTVF